MGEGKGQPLCLGSWPRHTHALCTLQDLKPSNVAVNEDCELRVRVLRSARIVGTYREVGVLHDTRGPPDPGFWVGTPG